ncbi:flagellar hook assembly protein FlgD [Pseudoduganella ginsengisoli]|uniref:Basal-body rod modification protein FlgD n=1 Tax=Pseudoduganella ginsengisoli TaxID=1462440 RepID=A0A6L6Q8T6_9BURK|nr:flagellar hook capping FlgD N-terminal domain-containing protein [Pseudoduganella ginsengisoli]MTW06070.1 flagellar basal body rod modification protein [Pseudoduganella ginsengisoli]
MQTNLFTTPANTTPANQSSVGTNPLATGTETSLMFTKLLVAQVQNQDPLSPNDPAAFVSQLTQLSQTEALQKLSTLTSTNATVLQGMQALSLGAQVGSNLTVSADTVQISETPAHGSFTLGSPSTATTLVLTGVDGVEHKVSLGMQAAGNVPFVLDPAALGLPYGDYKMRVETSTKESPPMELTGRLNSVRLGSGGAVVLNIAGVGEVSPSAISAFNGKSTVASTN